jgi:polysaccharide biosynthesis/export protein
VNTLSTIRDTGFMVFSVMLCIGLLLPGCRSSELTKDEALSSWTKRVKRQTVDSDNYLIQKGDQIEVSVAGYPEYNCTALVGESGLITVPLLGDLLAVQQTRAQLTDQLTKRLSDYVKTAAIPALKIRGALEQKVIILGSVTTQGSYTIASSVSALQALAMAGGPNASADLRHIKIFRSQDESTTELDISNSFASITGTMEAMPAVNPGDLLYVPKEENVVRDFADLLRDVLVLFGFFAVVR